MKHYNTSRGLILEYYCRTSSQVNSCGDGKELFGLAEFNNGNCSKCDLKDIDPRFQRGRIFSRQQISLNSVAAVPINPELRRLKKANLYSRRFSESQKKNLAQKR